MDKPVMIGDFVQGPSSHPATVGSFQLISLVFLFAGDKLSPNERDFGFERVPHEGHQVGCRLRE